jgi:photosystem II stability/assembly factor-like uncharacterized protein
MLLCLMFPGCKMPGRPQFAMPKIHMVTGENLHSVVAFSPQESEVFGNMGVILRTASGGETTEAWEKIQSGTGDSLLCDAAFVDRENGWAVGIRGTIIHSTDGGKTWSAQNSGTEKNLFSVSFPDLKNGWIVGEFGTIIHTGDGGATWQPQSKGMDKELNGVYFVNERRGWLVGEFGTILHTEDGGASWEAQTCEDIQTNNDMFSYDWRPMPALYGVHFLNADTGLIVGADGIILKTDDGGKKWRKLQSNCDVPLYAIEMVGNNGWIVGNRGTYLVSRDAGETWQVKDGLIKTRFWLKDVSFSDENNGWIVGAMGTLVRTVDGGVSWQLISGMSYDMAEYGLADF